MGSQKQLTLIILIYLSPITVAWDVLRLWNYDCSFWDTGSYTVGSTYETNLNNTLSAIISDTSNTNGFYNVSTGKDPNRVNAIGLCRGDVASANLTLCRECLNHASMELETVCPLQKEAIGWEDRCMLWYSGSSIIGRMETLPMGTMCSPPEQIVSVADVAKYDQLRNELFSLLRKKATSGNPPSYFADGKLDVTEDLQVYAMVQCTPDLSGSSCSQCLDSASKEIPNACDANRRGGRIQMPSCNIRFEADPFYIGAGVASPTIPDSSSGDASPSQAPSHASGKGMSKWKKVILIVVPLVAIASALAVVFIFYYLRSHPRKASKKWEDEIGPSETLQFDFKTIEAATDCFSEANKLGQGGFGGVYKGILSDGQEIAVKRLSENSGQGQLEFKNEVLLLAKLQHKNLVRFFGFCLHGQERLLIYEFVSNGSLDHYIFDTGKSAGLDYETRYKIIVGIARGLLYLHEDSRLTVIHRDLKASNVLLDKDMNPKISDFGLAKLIQTNEIHAQTNNVKGTFGYMAPEYAIHGKISVKLDVYSFGVLTLEIIAGQRNSSCNTNEADLITLVWKHWLQGRATDIVQALETPLPCASKTEMLRCIHIGLLCVQENAADRPTMSAVFLMLNSNSINLPLPSPPSFLSISNMPLKMPQLQSNTTASSSVV